MMPFMLSQRSKAKLATCHKDLQAVVNLAIERSTVDFGVTCGLRTVDEQKALYAKGRTAPGPIVTWTMNSRHLSGKAVDLVALVAGVAKWDMCLYERIDHAMQSAALELEIPIVWGGTFEKRDGPHWELDRRFYK